MRKGDVSSDEDWRQLNIKTQMPLYMVHDLGLGFGAIGGVIQSGETQGRNTGRVLLQVLANPNEPLPPVVAGAPEIKTRLSTNIALGSRRRERSCSDVSLISQSLS